MVSSVSSFLPSFLNSDAVAELSRYELPLRRNKEEDKKKSQTQTVSLVTSGYEFKVLNRSLCEKYFLNTFWNTFIEYFPLNIAPNLMTFTGFIFQFVAYLLMMHLWPTSPLSRTNDLSEVVHAVASSPYLNHTYIAIITFIFIYQTLDGCDGKQARRTGTSSPLGEIFDHGADALCLNIYVTNFLLIYQIYPTDDDWILVVALTMIYFASFFSAHWEHYQTNYFFMGELSTSDAQVAIVLLMVATIILSPTWWLTHIVTIAGFKITTGKLGYFIFAIAGVTSIFAPMVNVYKFYKYGGVDKKEYRAYKGATFFTALRDYHILVVFQIVVGSYLVLSAQSGLMKTHFPIIQSTCIPTFGIFLSSTNLARVGKTKMPSIFTKQLLAVLSPIALAVVNFMASTPVNPVFMAYAALVTNVSIYLMFATSIIQQFSQILRIKPFSIPKL